MNWSSPDMGVVFSMLMMGVALALLLVIIVSRRANRQLQWARNDAVRRERRQRAIADLLSMLVSSKDRHEVVELALKTIGSYLKADRCYLLRHDQRHHEIRLVSEFRADPLRQKPSPKELRMKIDRAVGWYCENGDNEWLFAPDVNDPDAVAKWGLNQAYNRELGIDSLYALKFMVNGRYWGNLGVTYERGVHTLTDEEREFIESCCRFFSLAIERIESEEALKAERDNAISAERAKSVFFAMVSHDIRSPLNAIIGFSELLKSGVEEAAVRKRYLESILMSGRTLLLLINDVLDLSRLEAGRMEIHPEPTDCRRLLHSVALAFESEASMKNVAVVTRSAGVPPVVVDPQRIRQILFNLVGNAVKFTDRGRIELRLEFEPDAPNADTGTLIVSVVDTGRGIDKDNIARLMHPYVRLDERLDRPGTGLGLSICHRLAQQMGGRIQVDSEPGKGSTFALVLNGVKSRALVEPRDTSRMAASIDWTAAGTQPCVLAVDDAPVNLSVLAAMLKRVGITDVVTATDGFDAQEKLQRNKVDLVLTDLWMPQMDGGTLLRSIRSDERFAKLPVFAITADVEAGKKECYSDFSGMLFKPVTIDGIRQLLDQWRQKNRTL